MLIRNQSANGRQFLSESMRHLRVARVAIALLMLVSVCGWSSNLIRRTTPRDLREDSLSVADHQFAGIRSVLPPSAVICFVHEPDIALDQRLQYAVAPIFVKPGSDCEFVVSYYPGLELSHGRSYVTLSDLGGGLRLSRRTIQ